MGGQKRRRRKVALGHTVAMGVYLGVFAGPLELKYA